MRHEVATLEELPQRVPRVVRVRDRAIVLVRWGETVYALHGVCPHMQQSFDGGEVLARSAGEPGDIVLDGGDPVLTCPWHQYEYRLLDGRCLVDDRLRVRRYDVEIEGTRVFVDLATPA